jgi:hypothetical protein
MNSVSFSRKGAKTQRQANETKLRALSLQFGFAMKQIHKFAGLLFQDCPLLVRPQLLFASADEK